MSRELHERTQKAAREQKARKAEAEAMRLKNVAFRRALICVEIDKKDLLRILKEECLVPEAATRIVATGHMPDSLSVTVTFDGA